MKKVHNFLCSDELWDKFAEVGEGDFESVSHGIRELMKRYIQEKEASA